MSSLSTQGGGGGSFINAHLTLQQIRELDLGKRDKPDFFNCKAMVTFIRKENMMYKVRTDTAWEDNVCLSPTPPTGLSKY